MNSEAVYHDAAVYHDTEDISDIVDITYVYDILNRNFLIQVSKKDKR